MQLLWIYWSVIETKASKISSYVGMYQLVTPFSDVFRVEKYNNKQTQSCLISGQKPSHPKILYQYDSIDVKLLII